MYHFASFILASALVVVTGCGQKSEAQQGASSTSATNVNADGSSRTTDGSMPSKPTYGGKLADCKVNGTAGCLTGYISHGLALTVAPKNGSEVHNVNGESVSLGRTAFNDAQDFADRFDTAFLKPLLSNQKAKNYDIKIAPTVKRDNFAVGFELYAEDHVRATDRVAMAGEGNFIIDGVSVSDEVSLRAVKTFRIEISRKSDADADAPEVSTPVICLEIDATLNALKVEGGKATSVGGLRNFDFYYTESAEICNQAKIPVAAQSRQVEASTLNNTTPVLP